MERGAKDAKEFAANGRFKRAPINPARSRAPRVKGTPSSSSSSSLPSPPPPPISPSPSPSPPISLPPPPPILPSPSPAMLPPPLPPHSPKHAMSVPSIPGIKINADLQREFQREVANLLRRNSTKFPGAQPVSFTRHHFAALERQDYYLCEKTDGIRCLLYCTEDETHQEIQYLIDRKNEYYFLDKQLHFPHQDDPTLTKFHVGTLVDGELVNDHEPDGVKLRYLAFDLVALDGESMADKPFQKRIARLNEFVLKPFRELYRRFPDDVARFPFEVRAKKMEKPYGIDMLFKEILPKLPHGNDGLVFQCAETPYVMGSDEHILKWKPPHENTIDFLLHLGAFPLFDPRDGGPPAHDYDAKPELLLMVFHGQDEYRPFAKLHVDDADWAVLKRAGEVLDQRIVECYKDDAGRWRFKRDTDARGIARPRFRDDKTEANHISTVTKVLESIEDGVTQQDLVDHALAMKLAWKRRHPEETR